MSEILWIMFVYCYLKQEETIAETALSNLTWIEKQLGKSSPEMDTAETSTTGQKPKAGSDLPPKSSMILEQTLMSNSPEKIQMELKNEENESTTAVNMLEPKFVAPEPLKETDGEPKTIANSQLIMTDLSPKTSMILEQTLMSDPPKTNEMELKNEENGSETVTTILEPKVVAPEPLENTDEEPKAIAKNQLMTDLSPKASMILEQTLMSDSPRKVEMEFKNEENCLVTATNILEPKVVAPEPQQKTEPLKETDEESKVIVKSESVTDLPSKSTVFEQTLRSNPSQKTEVEFQNVKNRSTTSINILESKVETARSLKETDVEPKTTQLMTDPLPELSIPEQPTEEPDVTTMSESVTVPET